MNDPILIPNGGRDFVKEAGLVERILHFSSEETSEGFDMDEEVVVFGRGP